MNTRLLFIALLAAFHCSTFGQYSFVKQWDYRFGGKGSDALYSFQQTNDQGYILGGYSTSGIGGDKTQAKWDTATNGNDYWIVKLDSNGNKLWDKDFGGTNYDQFTSCQQTKDKGYILGGWSVSEIGGDKTQALHGAEDYWIIKLDSIGNKQWDKDFGGISYNRLASVQQTVDKGYILGGNSNSGIGGDKTQTTKGGYDYWIIKLDSTGTKQWDKDFGGMGDEVFHSVQQTKDGGYILGGYSSSGIGGDKTQISKGNYDYWIIKLDSTGTKQWDKDFGGSDRDYLYSLRQTPDGGYILGGYSKSGISGDKSQPTKGEYDYWIIKLDSIGTKQWDNSFGGIEEELFRHIFQTSDAGFLLSGDSWSSISGDKTENNLGPEQGWIIKTDSLGLLQWDKTIFFPSSATACASIQTPDGCYVFAGRAGDTTGGYNTQIGRGGTDYWIVKFCMNTVISINEITNQPQINIYPNPFTSDISISLTQPTNTKAVATFTITNLLGEIIYKREEANLSSSYTKLLDLSFLPNGLYLLEVIIDGERAVRKLVKQNH